MKNYNYGGFNSDQENNLRELYSCKLKDYSENVTGNACIGDDVVYAKAVFSGSYRNAKFSHFELLEGVIVKDSYGKTTGQHTFTIEAPYGRYCVKGRNLYKYLTLAKVRVDEERDVFLEDKYRRGAKSRKKKEQRTINKKNNPLI